MSKTFYSCRSDMYHFVASSDYKGDYVRSANSHICGNDVYSYATKVAEFDKNKEILLYTGHHYSNTTTNSLYELKRAFDHYKKLKVYDFDTKAAWNRLKVSVKEHIKYPATRKDDKTYFIETVDSLKNLIEFRGKNSKYLKTSTFETADRIATKYLDEIEAKRKRYEELAAERRKRDEELRQLRINRTEAIVSEFNPDIIEEPTTFRQCMQKTQTIIPFSWLIEHHPEVFTNDSHCELDNSLTCFRRFWNNTTHGYTYDAVYNKDRESYKIMRQISRWSGAYPAAPDILVYESDRKLLRTSQYCEVDDTNGHVKNLLGLFLKAIDENRPVDFVIGKHCGPYEIREYNYNEKFLRVGCHCFLLENLREVYNDMLEVKDAK